MKAEKNETRTAGSCSNVEEKKTLPKINTPPPSDTIIIVLAKSIKQKDFQIPQWPSLYNPTLKTDPDSFGYNRSHFLFRYFGDLKFKENYSKIAD